MGFQVIARHKEWAWGATVTVSRDSLLGVRRYTVKAGNHKGFKICESSNEEIATLVAEVARLLRNLIQAGYQDIPRLTTWATTEKELLAYKKTLEERKQKWP